MYDSAIMEYVKWITGGISALFISVIIVFLFQINELNSFQQEVNYEIERHGGLTTTAKQKINTFTKDAYGGCIVRGPRGNDAVTCYFASDRTNGVKPSGFFVREYKGASSKTYYDRPDSETLRYGEKTQYVVSRQLGKPSSEYFSYSPVKIGEAASRIRGSAVN